MHDLKEAERRFRATLAAAHASADSADPSFACQMRGSEVELQFLLWRLSEENAGHSPCLFSFSAGALVGSMLRAYVEGMALPADQAHHMSHFFDGLTASFNAGQVIGEVDLTGFPDIQGNA